MKAKREAGGGRGSSGEWRRRAARPRSVVRPSDDQREMLLLQARRAVCGRHSPPVRVWVSCSRHIYQIQNRAGFCTAVLRLVLATARVFRIYLSTYNKVAVPSIFYRTLTDGTSFIKSNKNGGASCERFESNQTKKIMADSHLLGATNL